MTPKARLLALADEMGSAIEVEGMFYRHVDSLWIVSWAQRLREIAESGCNDPVGTVMCQSVDEHGEADVYIGWHRGLPPVGSKLYTASEGQVATEEADLRCTLAEIYESVPPLPITAETMHLATDSLTAFCMMIGSYGIDLAELAAAIETARQSPGEGA